MATATVSVTQRKSWNTLQRLRGLRAVILLFDVLLLVLVLNAVDEQRRLLRAIVDREAPAVVAAERLQFALRTMEASTARELLQRDGDTTALIQAQEGRRSEAARALLQAIQDSPDAETGRTSLETLQLGLGTYERIVGNAEEGKQQDAVTGAMLFRRSTDLMDGRLLPAARELQGRGEETLRDSFRRLSVQSAEARAGVIAACLLSLVALAFAQLYLSRQTHRTFNLPLLGATALMVILGAHLLSVLARSHRELALAEGDPFASVHTLWHIRELAYATDLEEGRYFLDRAHGGLAEKTFGQKAATLAGTPAGLTTDQLAAALREGHSLEGFTGLLAAEIDRKQFSDERDMLVKALPLWERYVSLDTRARHPPGATPREQALQLYAGRGPGQAQEALLQFDETIAAASAMSQAEFDDGMARGLAAIRGTEFETGAAVAAIAALVAMGFAPRLREYR